MNKIDCIIDYFSSTRAFYLFYKGNFLNDNFYKSFILDKKYLIGAKVACVSNIMLAIKEDVVFNSGNLVYKSKIFLSSLEKSASFIATKVDNGYKLGNYVFSDVSLMVAVIRNKFAHGDYIIDFEHNRVILNYKENEIIINVDKLINFILMAFNNTMKDMITDKYERNLVYYTRGNKNRVKKIRDLSEVKSIVRNINYVNFILESVNGMPINENCIKLFDAFLNFFNKDTYMALKSDKYKILVLQLFNMGCSIRYEYKNLRDNDEINRIVNFASNEIVGNENLDYDQQIEVLELEVLKSINKDILGFDVIAANVNNLFILNAISKTNSVDRDVLSNYIFSQYNTQIRSGYGEYGITLISMFNSLFMYPFDDVYDNVGGYTYNRKDSFDFSKLDLSMINPVVITIDKQPLIDAENKINKIVSNQVNVSKKILVQRENLKKVSRNVNAINAINNNILNMEQHIISLFNDYLVSYNEYNNIYNDFNDNLLYFRNKAIIEGIRNSIAHGSYEFLCVGNYNDTQIIFNDIYDGNLTFNLKISFSELEMILENNFPVVMDYLYNKDDVSFKK